MPAGRGRGLAKSLLLLTLLLTGSWLLSGCGGGGSDTTATSGGAETGEVLITLTDAEGNFVTDLLAPGTEIAGPAIIEEETTTLVVHPGARARVSDGGRYLLSPPEEETS